MPLFPSDLPETIFAHCDGGSRGNPGPSGYGAVITDTGGQKIAELSEFLGIRTNNYAEYSGLLAVLAYAVENKRLSLKVVSDSELMVKQIQGKYKVNSPDLKPLWQEARDRIAKLKSFEISHALRHKNKDADALANQAMDRGMKKGEYKATPTAPQITTREPQKTVASPVALPAMLRGFTKDGSIHLLGGATLPNGIFVKIVPE